MPDAPRHARPRGWKALRRSLIAGAILLSPAFFIVMFRTVTALVRPSFGVWAWTVPVATEGCFLLLYGLDILLEWARKPKGWLRFTPYPFAAASLVLNVWADKDSLGGMLGHAIVTVAFFLPVIAAESAVRDLAVTDAEMRMREAVADARQYAIDLCRSRRGRLWRWRIPVLLRTQILTGRLPDEVRDAITEMLGEGRTSGWQAPVRAWVLGPDGLNLAAQAAEDARRAHASITRQAPPPPSAAALPEVTAPAPPGAITAASPKSAATAIQKVRRAGGRKASDEDILEAIREMFADGSAVTKYRVVKELKGPHGGIAEPRAGRLLDVVRAERPQLHLAAK
jgi:hypothetical protein